jgi:WD40 repeat protein
VHSVDCITVHYNRSISGAFEGTIKIWNLLTGEFLYTIARLHTRAVTSIIILSNETFTSCLKIRRLNYLI